eukprot:CAMPEP_0206473362 /NCGR_PEP_ID=MMETSP0324_2-20121206/32810_1 /ASSEMBLY_ACC=CAM_ASM_000836 /TAXON_ID=2866 /ORGANISM="Crypthecodinium cohnii, Strain Seligo" /LENGTH=67 /DNA_ID=CAMNT_0053948257 /DNA_START=118 /DNA_END=321 /DNA_ORIENTATION=+
MKFTGLDGKGQRNRESEGSSGVNEGKALMRMEDDGRAGMDGMLTGGWRRAQLMRLREGGLGVPAFAQ